MNVNATSRTYNTPAQSQLIDQQRATQTTEPRLPTDQTATSPHGLDPQPTQPTAPSLERSLDARRTVQAGDVRTQHLQATLAAPGDAPADGAEVAAAGGTGAPRLRSGYESLQTLSHVLPRKDGRFNPETQKGRAAMVLALAIGGTEVHGRGTSGTDFFTRRGGSGNKMLGFAQFNMTYHRAATKTPEGYSKLLADMLTGAKPLPSAKGQGDYAARLVQAVDSGKVKNGEDLKRWMRAQGFGGMNWQGIDDGWQRVPGLGDDLVKFLREGRTRPATVANA